MNQMKYLLSICVGLALIHGSSVSASLIVPNGQIQLLEDSDFELMFFDDNSDGIVDVGDRFLGVYKVQGYDPDVSSVPGATNIGATEESITALFILEAIRKDIPGAVDDVEIFFGPTQSPLGTNAAISEWAAILAAAPFSFMGADLTALTPTDNGTMALIFGINELGDADETSGSLTGSIGNYTGVSTSTTGAVTTLMYEIGFTGNPAGGGTPTGFGPLDEFWLTSGDAGIDNTNSLLILGADNSIGVNVLVHHAGPTLLEHAQLAIFDALHNTRFASGHDVQGQGGFTGQPAGDFDIATDTDFYIRPLIPEPTSLVAWLGLSATACVATCRRRRSNQESRRLT